MDTVQLGSLVTVAQIVEARRPIYPIHCIRPQVLEYTSRTLIEKFPGQVLYSVKCNPDPDVIRAVQSGGVAHFDVASWCEIETLRDLIPESRMHFMHPIKPRWVIRAAYGCGIRDFALDSMRELDKIVEETETAPDLGLFIRIALPAGGAVLDLSDKFGADIEQAVFLLRAARCRALRLGICFHVGSQCMDPRAFTRALDRVAKIHHLAGVPIDIIDIGGGFPVSYPGLVPPSLDEFIEEIMTAIESFRGIELWCEPGRAIAAPGGSLVVQVLDRRDHRLFINDGVFGNLMDAGVHGFCYPTRLIRVNNREYAEQMCDFSLMGPTCDSTDRMVGPFTLPADIDEGDWIELGQLGAYSACMRTNFNGFGKTEQVEVCDPPMLITPGYEVVRHAA